MGRQQRSQGRRRERTFRRLQGRQLSDGRVRVMTRPSLTMVGGGAVGGRARGVRRTDEGRETPDRSSRPLYLPYAGRCQETPCLPRAGVVAASRRHGWPPPPAWYCNVGQGTDELTGAGARTTAAAAQGRPSAALQPSPARRLRHRRRHHGCRGQQRLVPAGIYREECRWNEAIRGNARNSQGQATAGRGSA
jgi:hypothetical protein